MAHRASRSQTQQPQWRVAVTFTAGLAIALGATPVNAQLIPDNSLGSESSVVRPGNSDATTDLIQGGAARGIHLFHSFQDFNIGAGQQVYFANPSGIEQIFSRVTGSTASQIEGLLGVAGPADLFLLNPQGILFGPNATLEIGGSFVGTTANAFEFSDGQRFGLSSSATTPTPLLTTTLKPGLQWGNGTSSGIGDTVANGAGSIRNLANLTVGQDLQLSAQNLDLQGQLQAGGDLTLQANEQLKVRDQVGAPFVAEAGEQLLLQGDRSLDIFALSHPNSQLGADGDLILRSGNSINGDAQFRSGGSFQVQQLDQSPGPFNSPKDPVIRAGGDVSFTDYQGSSLHVLAGGQVTADTITILGAAIGAVAEDFLQETVAQSDGTVVDIDGSARPTLDIRAGVSPTALGNALGTSGDSSGFGTAPVDSTSATGADISLGNVTVAAPNGQVFLTNQYQPNPVLAGGNITLDSLQGNDQGSTPFSGNGTDLAVDARQDFSLGNQADISSATGKSGSITLLAQGDVRLDQSKLISQNTGTATARQGGSISIQAGNITLSNGAEITTNVGATAAGTAGDITLNGTQVRIIDGSSLEASTSGIGDGGNISISATEKVSITGPDSYVRSYVESTGVGQAGDILIQAPEIEVDNAEVRSTSRPRNGDSGQGNAGNITFNAPNTIRLANKTLIDASVDDNGTSAGSITMTTGIFEMSDETKIISFSDSTVAGPGQPENIEIRATESFSVDSASEILALQGDDSTGNAGDIFIQSPRISIANDSKVISNSDGQGDAGQVTLLAPNGSISVSDGGKVKSRISRKGTGQAGDVLIESPDVEVFGRSEEGSDIASQSNGKGNAGNVTIRAGNGRIRIEDEASVKSTIEPRGVGNAGDVLLEAATVAVLDTAFLLSKSEPRRRDSGQGNAGKLTIIASESVVFADEAKVGTSVDDNGSFAGDISIRTGEFEMRDEAELFAVADGAIIGDKNGGGDIEIIATESFKVTDESKILTDQEDDSFGDAGNILIQSPDIEVSERSSVSSVSRGNGNGGSIRFEAGSGDIRLEDGGVVGANVEDEGFGSAGNIFLNAQNITLLGRKTKVESRNRSVRGGTGGDITITGDRFTIPNGGTVVASVEEGAKGNSGNILIQVRELETDNFSFQSNSLGDGSAGNITIIATDSASLQKGSVLTRINNTGTGTAGNIILETQDLELRNGGRFIAGTEGNGPGGNITLKIPGKILITGETPPIANCTSTCESGFHSTVSERALEDSLNRGGSITGLLGQLTISEGGRIDVSSQNLGQAGSIDLTVESIDLQTGGQLSSSALGAGDGGDIKVVASDRITITDSDSGLLARTSDLGNAGQIEIQTPQLSIQDNGLIATAADATAKGNAGGVTINPGPGNNSLDITLQDGTITAETQSIGAGGDLILTAPEAINIRGKGILTAQTSATGSAGNVSVTTDRLTIDQGTTLSTTATATANPPANEDGTKANINLNANEMNLFGTVQVLSETQGNAQAGRLTLQPNGSDNLAINLREGSRVSASTSGSGSGGQLSLLAPKTLTISGEGSLSAETSGSGAAGAVLVKAQDFTLQNGAQLSTSTSGSGSGGNISINAENSVTISDRAQLKAETLGGGDAGTVDVQTQQFTLEDGAVLSTSTAAAGSGGNITLNAPKGVTLQNQAQLLAQSTDSASGKSGNINLTSGQLELNNDAGITVRSINTGDGGNININATRPILMNNRSVIETDAGGSGNGGNIAITTPFLIGFGDANADIIANAVSGNGGKVTIEAQRILNFGIQDGQDRSSLRSNGSNDISASSETGTSGTVALDTLDVDPSRGLAELPVDLTDPGDRISQGCRASSSRNSFVTSGRGGIPQGPDAPLRSAAAAQGWITPEGNAVSSHQSAEVVEPTFSEASETIEQITEVQGWERDSSGQVRLVVAEQGDHSGESTVAAQQVALNCKAEPVHATMPEHD